MHQQRHDEQRERQRSRKQKMLAEYADHNAMFSRAADKPGPVKFGDPVGKRRVT